MKEYRMGKAKPLDAVSLEDLLEHPIWIDALGEEDVEGQDETWQQPILDTTDVSLDMWIVYLLLKEKETGTYINAMLDVKRMKLELIYGWNGSEWETVDRFGFEAPVFLEAVPSIRGHHPVQFRLSEDGTEAYAVQPAGDIRRKGWFGCFWSALRGK